MVLATPLRSVDEYADEDGNVSMKIRQRFRDTDEIRSRRRVISAALLRHGEEGPREVVLARGTSTSYEDEAEEITGTRAGGRRRQIGRAHV